MENRIGEDSRRVELRTSPGSNSVSARINKECEICCSGRVSYWHYRAESRALSWLAGEDVLLQTDKLVPGNQHHQSGTKHCSFFIFKLEIIEYHPKLLRWTCSVHVSLLQSADLPLCYECNPLTNWLLSFMPSDVGTPSYLLQMTLTLPLHPPRMAENLANLKLCKSILSFISDDEKVQSVGRSGLDLSRIDLGIPLPTQNWDDSVN